MKNEYKKILDILWDEIETEVYEEGIIDIDSLEKAAKRISEEVGCKCGSCVCKNAKEEAKL